MTGKFVFFLLLVGLSFLLLFTQLKLLIESSFCDELYPHIIIPLVSVYLLFIKGGEIFLESSFSFIPVTFLISVGVVFSLVGIGESPNIDLNDFLSMIARLAFFPLLFLFFPWGQNWEYQLYALAT